MADQYLLKTGESGEQQLDNLDRFFGTASREFLIQIGLKEGMRILDVGCKVGNLSCWLANRVGATGQVVGIDHDSNQIEVAEKRAQEKGIRNISFQQADAHELSNFKNQFDLVYCRWLLVHVKDPTTVVRNMANAVRVNGLLACEVGDMSSTFYYPAFPRYIYLCKKLAELLTMSGCDIEISLNIFKTCNALNHFSFDAQLSQQVIYDAKDAKDFTVNFCLVLDSISESLLKNNLMSQEDIDQLKLELQSHPIDKNTLIFLARMTQVWCRRLK